MPGEVVIGVGNLHRCDDAVGLHVARRLRALLPLDIRIHECLGEATELMACWNGTSKTVVVDALDVSRPAGDILRLDVSRGSLPASLKQASTHAFGLAEAVELARALGELPAEIVVYGVQGGNFQPGNTLTPAVADAIDSCCLKIQAEF